MALMDVFTHFSIIRRERRGIRPEEIKELSQQLLKPVVPLANRTHLAPLGWRNGDQELADNVIKSIQELRAKLISCYPQSQEKEEVLMKMISEH